MRQIIYLQARVPVEAIAMEQGVQMAAVVVQLSTTGFQRLHISTWVRNGSLRQLRNLLIIVILSIRHRLLCLPSIRILLSWLLVKTAALQLHPCGAEMRVGIQFVMLVVCVPMFYIILRYYATDLI